VQQRAGSPGIDLLPELADMHVDHVGLWVEVMFPDVFEEHRPRDHLVDVASEIFQKLEFSPLQLDRLSVARHSVRKKVDAQVGDGEHRLDFDALRPARESLEPREKLTKGEGLRQVIITPCPQPTDPIVDFGERTEDKDGCSVGGSSQRFYDAQTVDAAREHAVQNERVLMAGGGEKETVAAIIGMVDDMPFLGQSFPDELRDSFVVLDEQDLHACRDIGIVAAIAPDRRVTARSVIRDKSG